MAGMPPAGARSGTHTGGVYLEGAKAFSGVVGDTLRMDSRSSSASPPSHVHMGGGQHCEVLARAPVPFEVSNSIRRSGNQQQLACIPGYAGHISGKAAENMHGSTFRVENQRATRHVSVRDLQRTQSEPHMLSATTMSTGSGSKALRMAPRIPGYTGNVPGKIAEAVHGTRFADACEQAQVLRDSNPFLTSEAWIRRGQWPSNRMHTHQWNNRFTKANMSSMFTEEEEQEARDANRRLGHTFGLLSSERNPHRPGDRFVHSLHHKVSTTNAMKF